MLIVRSSGPEDRALEDDKEQSIKIHYITVSVKVKTLWRSCNANAKSDLFVTFRSTKRMLAVDSTSELKDQSETL